MEIGHDWAAVFNTGLKLGYNDCLNVEISIIGSEFSEGFTIKSEFPT